MTKVEATIAAIAKERFFAFKTISLTVVNRRRASIGPKMAKKCRRRSRTVTMRNNCECLLRYGDRMMES